MEIISSAINSGCTNLADDALTRRGFDVGSQTGPEELIRQLSIIDIEAA
jgi:hypothetical protein